MALTITPASLIDWTALASNTLANAGVIDSHESYETIIHFQAFLDNETAHTGTEFIVQGSSATTGDEDWYDIIRFIDLVAATHYEEPQLDNPWAAASDLRTEVAATAGFTTGLADGPAQWIAIEDGTLVNSEIMLMTGGATNDYITVLNDRANEHAVNTNLYTAAMSRSVNIGIGHYRLRVLINNTYDINGGTLNYRVRYILTTAL